MLSLVPPADPPSSCATPCSMCFFFLVSGSSAGCSSATVPCPRDRHRTSPQPPFRTPTRAVAALSARARPWHVPARLRVLPARVPARRCPCLPVTSRRLPTRALACLRVPACPQPAHNRPPPARVCPPPVRAPACPRALLPTRVHPPVRAPACPSAPPCPPACPSLPTRHRLRLPKLELGMLPCSRSH
ncbi:hypothetical protein BRADI_2g37993v3 [Brachypodium distachyon]|uniref:Uncharacterized protein n=1 Tax=Brachypodium distachyon TaxID=15368 RepID=A0A2K2DCH0_BRADI|nr:hypothetical protein BRADI_2g37993v3 [Brachypodium distachyon]